MTTKGFVSPKTTLLTTALILLFFFFLPLAAFADSDNTEVLQESSAPAADTSAPGSSDASCTAEPSGGGAAAPASSAGASTGLKKLESCGAPEDTFAAENSADASHVSSEPASESVTGGAESGAEANAPDAASLSGADAGVDPEEALPDAKAPSAPQEEPFEGEENKESPAAKEADEKESSAPVADNSSKGNSFIAEIDNSAILVGAPEKQLFTISLTEVGEDSIAKAIIKLPAGFSATDTDALKVQASNGGSWSASYDSDDNKFELELATDSEPVIKGHALFFTFMANVPDEAGVYEFTVSAFLDDVNENTMLGINPLVIIGHPVSSESDLADIGKSKDGLAGYYIQTKDIDISAENWTPIGSWGDGGEDSNPFTGAYHGNGYVIRNLQIDNGDLDEAGLFGYTHTAVLFDVALEDVFVRGYNNVGALAGGLRRTRVIGASAKGFVAGNNCVGGLFGQVIEEAVVLKSLAQMEVEGQNGVGGLAGYSWGSSTIEFSCAAGSVSGKERVGGLVGCAEHSRIGNSYAAGKVSGVHGVGGLVGDLIFEYDEENDSYYDNCHSTVVNCYSSAQVTGSSDTGGLVGFVQDACIVQNSFYDLETSGQPSSGYGEPKATALMQSYHTYADALWSVTGEGGYYPWLWWQNAGGPAFVWHLPPVLHEGCGVPDCPGLIDVPCPGNTPGLIDVPCSAIKHSFGCAGYRSCYAPLRPFLHQVYGGRPLPQTSGSPVLFLVAFVLVAVGAFIKLWSALSGKREW